MAKADKKKKGPHFKNHEAMVEFGLKVRALRSAKKMTIEAIANTNDISANQWGRIERGETNVTITTIFMLADIFRIKPSELLDF